MINNNSNFPPNVDPLDKSAPWNQEWDIPKRVKVCCIQGLSKTYEIEDCENLFYSFKNDNKVYNIPKLLQELQSLVEVKIKELKSALPSKDPTVNKLRKGIIEHYEDVLDASKGWVLDDEDVCRE